jgi:predicted HAD superfamily Cof-like phosphohydrolase
MVNDFMRQARQELPDAPTIPSPEVRRLRAKLILEEALETIEALGFWARVEGQDWSLEDRYEPNLPLIVDGCCDLKVVTTGTLSACGIPDQPFQDMVDENNLAKFGPGHTIRSDGKLIKPPGHKPPDIQGMIESLVRQYEDRGLYGEQVIIPPQPPAPSSTAVVGVSGGCGGSEGGCGVGSGAGAGGGTVVVGGGGTLGAYDATRESVAVCFGSGGGLGYRAEDERLPFSKSQERRLAAQMVGHEQQLAVRKQTYFNSLDANDLRVVVSALEEKYGDIEYAGDNVPEQVAKIHTNLTALIELMERGSRETSNEPPAGGISQHSTTQAITD